MFARNISFSGAENSHLVAAQRITENKKREKNGEETYEIQGVK
jgi:hypothetical protein